MEPTLILRPGRDKSVRRLHPWILSGSLADMTGDPSPGDTVMVVSAAGEALGRAAYSPASRIRARMWTFDPDITVDDEFVGNRLIESAHRRANLSDITDSCRLVFSEADGVPGVIADRYGDTIVVQFGSVGADAHRDVVADTLMSLDGVSRVYERSDVSSRQREGLVERVGLLRGTAFDPRATIVERGYRFGVAFEAGQKTGFYLDQRNSRAAVAEVAGGRRVLDVFSYTGGFSVVAAANGASQVTALDSSAAALCGAAENAALNGVAIAEPIEGDAFTELRRLRDRAKSYDLIMLDPPKLAQTEAQVARASRAYKDLNLLGIKLLAPGGILMTFSCSGGMSAELFQKVVAGAALDARRTVRIIGRLEQPSDHPIPLAFPEASYLKGLILRAD